MDKLQMKKKTMLLMMSLIIMVILFSVPTFAATAPPNSNLANVAAYYIEHVLDIEDADIGLGGDTQFTQNDQSVGPFISYWNEEKLGSQPSVETVMAYEDEWKVWKEQQEVLENQALPITDSGFNEVSTVGVTDVSASVPLTTNSGGHATVNAGDTEVEVTFGQEYETAPVVTVTPLEFIDGQYKIEEKTTSGFTIVLQNVQEQVIAFDWHAFGSVHVGVHTSGTDNVDDDSGVEDVVAEEEEEEEEEQQQEESGNLITGNVVLRSAFINWLRALLI